jgi:polyphenol oxidase
VVTPGTVYEHCDGLWSDEPGRAMLLLTADCLPIAIARRTGRPAVSILHAGWRGLLNGVVAAGVGALGDEEVAAAIGPGIGPCCYEVGEEVSSLFDEDLTVDRRLDLWTAAERALRRAGVASVERLDVCTRCHPELFFSHRRSGRARGVQGVIGALA